MKKIMAIATFLVFAGAAHAQTPSMGTLGGAPGDLSTPSLDSTSFTIAPTPIRSNSSNSDSSTGGNTSGTNPGPYVPSTFANFKDAVAEAKTNQAKKSMTLADVAREAQAQKKASEPKTAIVLDQDSKGKLTIAGAKKQ